MKSRNRSPLNSPEVYWIEPVVARGQASWPVCQGKVITPQVIEFRTERGESMACDWNAKINFRGQFLCVRHAAARALHEILGDLP